MNRTTLSATLAGLVSLVFFAVPATAFGLQKNVVFFEFDSSLTQSDRVDFVDKRYDEYTNLEIDGLFIAGQGKGWIVLEGDSSDVDNEIQDLKGDSRLHGVETVSESNPGSSTWAEFETHTELDPRGNADATGASNLQRSYVRVKLDSGTTDSEKRTILDDYFQDFSSKGLGGLAIAGQGKGWMPIEIEGDNSHVEGAIDDLKNDSRISSVTVLRTTHPSNENLPELWSHAPSDSRESTSN